MLKIIFNLVFPSLLNIEGSDHYSEGQTLHLRCKVKVFPPPAIIWIVEGSSKSRILRTTSRVSVSTTHFIENVEPYSMSNLYINNVISEDSNTYMCIVSADSHDVIQITVRNVTIIRKVDKDDSVKQCGVLIIILLQL